MKNFISVDFPVWRILPIDLLNTPAAAARAPEGRFHHSGQTACYASLTSEGAKVAIQRYLNDKTERKLVPMRLKADRVADERDNIKASVIWQDLRSNGLLPPTWAISDPIRESGAQAMLYSSRSRPDLIHVVVFEPKCLSFIGPISSMR